jgi:DHA1 family tetracycline resistance protein-like MFS transporter
MSTDPAPTPARKPRTAATIFVVGTVGIDAMAFAIVMPVLPQLLMELTASGIGVAAFWGGLATFGFAVMQFICSPIIGGLSDRFGRRPVMLLSLTALALDFLLMGLAHALFVFFFARLLSGIFAATHSTANAYIADISTPAERAKRYGWLGAAAGAGFILGPALGGLVGDTDPRAPFFLAAGLAGLNVLYGLFVVPESLAEENRRAFDWTRANPLGTLMRLRQTEGLGILIWVYTCMGLSGFVYPSVWTYVAIAKFGWTPSLVGLSLAVYGAIYVICQTVMVPVVIPRLGERRTIWIALCVEIGALFGFAFAPSGFWVYFWISFAVFTGLQDPALMKIMTERVGRDAQGELQGGLASLGAIVLAIAPLLYTQLFYLFEGGLAGIEFAGAPFLASAGFSALALVLFLGRTRVKKEV